MGKIETFIFDKKLLISKLIFLFSKYPCLSKIPFPSKKAFGNLDKTVLEKRRSMLDAYLKDLLKPQTLQDNPELVIFMTRFLDHTSTYESERQSNVIKSMRNSVKSAANVVTSVPSNIIHSVDYMVDGLSKVLTNDKPVKEPMVHGKVGASLETEPGDNIPLRIILLFMDEVFDLQERNQWLRRQIVAVLRQLIKAMFGKKKFDDFFDRKHPNFP